jgi:hypothetical protein
MPEDVSNSEQIQPYMKINKIAEKFAEQLQSERGYQAISEYLKQSGSQNPFLSTNILDYFSNVKTNVKRDIQGMLRTLNENEIEALYQVAEANITGNEQYNFLQQKVIEIYAKSLKEEGQTLTFNSPQASTEFATLIDPDGNIKFSSKDSYIELTPHAQRVFLANKFAEQTTYQDIETPLNSKYGSRQDVILNTNISENFANEKANVKDGIRNLLQKLDDTSIQKFYEVATAVEQGKVVSTGLQTAYNSLQKDIVKTYANSLELDGQSLKVDSAKASVFNKDKHNEEASKYASPKQRVKPAPVTQPVPEQSEPPKQKEVIKVVEPAKQVTKEKPQPEKLDQKPKKLENTKNSIFDQICNKITKHLKEAFKHSPSNDKPAAQELSGTEKSSKQGRGK